MSKLAQIVSLFIIGLCLGQLFVNEQFVMAGAILLCVLVFGLAVRSEALMEVR